MTKKKKRGNKWTEERIRTVLRILDEGLTSEEIAKFLTEKTGTKFLPVR